MGAATKYIKFGRAVWSSSGKTKIWRVKTINDMHLGEIRWYGSWRCYAFYPFGLTVFEHKCLRIIADFCEKQTQKHKRKKK